jgi:hypothetical protein
MAWTLQNYIDQIRQKIDDTQISNRMEEDLTDLVVGGNGARTNFPLSHQLVNVSQPVLVDMNMNGYAGPGTPPAFTVINGILTFTTPPPLSNSYPTPTSLRTIYYWNHFTDSYYYEPSPGWDIDEFINQGLGKMNFNPLPEFGGDTSYENLKVQEFGVVCLYAVHFAYMKLSARYSRQTDQEAEGNSNKKSDISKNYLNLAKEALDDAEKERLAINGPRQGRATVAAIAFGRTMPRSARQVPR